MGKTKSSKGGKEEPKVRKSALKSAPSKESQSTKGVKEAALAKIKNDVLKRAREANTDDKKPEKASKVEKAASKESKTKDVEAPEKHKKGQKTTTASKQEKEVVDPKQKAKTDKKEKNGKNEDKTGKEYKKDKEKKIAAELASLVVPKTPPPKRVRMKSPASSNVSTTASSSQYSGGRSNKEKATAHLAKIKASLPEAAEDAEMEAELEASGMLNLLDEIKAKGGMSQVRVAELQKQGKHDALVVAEDLKEDAESSEEEQEKTIDEEESSEEAEEGEQEEKRTEQETDEEGEEEEEEDDDECVESPMESEEAGEGEDEKEKGELALAVQNTTRNSI